MTDEKAIYWLTQIVGWFLFVLLILFQNYLKNQVDVGLLAFLIVNFAVGLGLSHFMRHLIIQFGMLRMKLHQVLPRILILSFTTALTAAILVGAISDLFFDGSKSILVYPFTLLLELLVPFSVIFLIWIILYFATIYLKNYEREEIKNLRLQASMNEVELGNLRSQLNPHFIFNAMNTIRALVDENPKEAKKSLTKISGILRSSLSSGKQTFVRLEEELQTVRNYLDLEKIRFEERLEYKFDAPEELNGFQIPPMLLQTLVENAVKHGISTLPAGGSVNITVRKSSPDRVKVEIANTGKYNPLVRKISESTGIGLTNSRRRLQLLYGKQAGISIYNAENEVICEVIIPRKPKPNLNYENTDY
ncbi:MAG TPA: histidine kinase [Cryomorphaceae bacterium]|nr:histidine kinase [Cryomorphaceae bacterium]